LKNKRCKPITKKGAEGIFEIIVDSGPGYRIYFCIESDTLYWLLAGGIKDSQDRDIDYIIDLRKRAKEFGYDQV